MSSSIRLSTQERYFWFEEVYRGTGPAIRLLAHILVLLHNGFDGNTIIAVLFTSTSTIDRRRQR